MRSLLRAVTGFFIGLVVTYAVVVGGMFWYASANNIVDRDGGMSMSIMFMLGPAAGILGGIFSAIAAPILFARRDRARTAGTLPPSKAWPTALRVVIAAFVGGFVGYFGTRLVLWMRGPMEYRTLWEAYAVGRAPLYVGIAASSIAAWIAYRIASRPPK